MATIRWGFNIHLIKPWPRTSSASLKTSAPVSKFNAFPQNPSKSLGRNTQTKDDFLELPAPVTDTVLSHTPTHSQKHLNSWMDSLPQPPIHAQQVMRHASQDFLHHLCLPNVTQTVAKEFLPVHLPEMLQVCDAVIPKGRSYPRTSCIWMI